MNSPVLSNDRIIALVKSDIDSNLYEVCTTYLSDQRIMGLFLHCTGGNFILSKEQILELDLVFSDHNLIVEVLD